MWFGALFGLGSLAVRPSLLESLVIMSRIDLILPAAAPPLGITARILVALILAAIGCVIGIVIARRLARPKPELRERKRKTLTSDEDDLQLRRRDAHPDAPARRPLSASDELGDDASAFGGSVLAARRRSLAMDDHQPSFVPQEFAPLPGAAPQVLDAAPQVLDIAACDLAAPAEAAPLDLGNYAEPVMTQPPVYAPAEEAAQPLPGAIARQMFQPEPHPAASATQLRADAADAAAAGQQVFGLKPQPAQSEADRQIFGQPIMGDHVSQDFVKAAGFQTTVFETPQPAPLFTPRELAASPVQPEPDAAFPEPVADAAVAEPLPPLPSPAGLGMTDLATRLAESMARRRAARHGEAAAAAAVMSAEPDPALAAPIPAAFESAAPSDCEAVAPVAAAPSAALGIAVPAALRPLDLDGFEDDDDSFESLLPPRHIAMPPVLQIAPAAEIAPEPVQAFAAPAADASNAETEVGADAESGAEDNYGSLLGLSVPAAGRPGFVRIDEPEADAAAIEPVVIFPGQMARAAEGADQASSFRRFDSPLTAEQGQPVATSPLGNEVDRSEADQALRMALANLQRMSGAA